MRLKAAIVIFIGTVSAGLAMCMSASIVMPAEENPPPSGGDASTDAPSNTLGLEYLGIKCSSGQNPATISLTDWTGLTGTMVWPAKKGSWQATQCHAEFRGPAVNKSEFMTVCSSPDTLPAINWNYYLPRNRSRFLPSTTGAGSCEYTGPNGYLCYRARITGDWDPNTKTITIGYFYGSEGRKPFEYPDAPAKTYSWKICIAEINGRQLDTECASVAPICCGSPPCLQ